MMTKRKPNSLLQVRQIAETWFLCLREISVHVGGESIKPFLLMLIDLAHEEVLDMDVYETRPDGAFVSQHLMNSMSQPKLDHLTPHRPKEVKFEQAELLNEIAPVLAEIHVASSLGEAPPVVDALIVGLTQTISSQPTELPGLLSVPGTDPEMIASLFEAAASFYRAAPWNRIADHQTLAVTIDPPGQKLFVQVMGNGGMEFGLSLYTSWEDVLGMFRPSDSPLDVLPESGMNGFTFGAKNDLPKDDQKALRKHGWKTAGSQAFPLPIVFTKEGGAERPSRQMLLYYEALMRGLPAFISHNLVDDEEDDFQPAEAVIESRHFDSPVKLAIRYPAGELPDLDEDESWLEDLFEEDDEDTIELPESLIEANRIADRAWEEQNPKERLRLAQQALKVSPDCTEAYLVLAFQTQTPEEAQKWLEKAVQAGERLLGQDFIGNNEGFLWDYRQARPYLRALDGLAENLEVLGRPEEALEKYETLLNLNDEDHQGARYQALRLLLNLRRDEEAEALIEEFDDDASTAWAYSRALLAFRQSGDLTVSRRALKQAIRANPHVPAYLTGATPLPAERPEAVGFGDESDAIDYALEHYPLWWSTPGAVDWLKKHR